MAFSDPYIDTLSMLNKIGPTLKCELAGLIEGCNLPLLLQLESHHHIERHDGDPDVVAITRTGLHLLGLKPVKVKARTISWSANDDGYNGAELKPFTGRPGCNAALALPSRQFNNLHYRDGRVVAL